MTAAGQDPRNEGIDEETADSFSEAFNALDEGVEFEVEEDSVPGFILGDFKIVQAGKGQIEIQSFEGAISGMVSTIRFHDSYQAGPFLGMTVRLIAEVVEDE